MVRQTFNGMGNAEKENGFLSHPVNWNHTYITLVWNENSEIHLLAAVMEVYGSGDPTSGKIVEDLGLTQEQNIVGHVVS